MNTLFLAWHDQRGRQWFPVGKLTRENGTYRFVYTRGANIAQQEGAFTSVPSFPDLDRAYESEQLFPIFSNRVLPRSRPDFRNYVEWLSLPKESDDPMALLARSGGERVTDTFEVFPSPEPDAEGLYHLHFFAHGLRHFAPSSIERAGQLQPGDPLLLLHDFQNRHDPNAVMVRTAETTPNDLHLLGYVPRFISNEAFHQMVKTTNLPKVTVLQVNQPPAPIQFRILCTMTARWTQGAQPFTGEMFEGVV